LQPGQMLRARLNTLAKRARPVFSEDDVPHKGFGGPKAAKKSCVDDVGGLLALGALDNLERDALAFFQ
jgi:hypothetical protein